MTRNRRRNTAATLSVPEKLTQPCIVLPGSCSRATEAERRRPDPRPENATVEETDLEVDLGDGLTERLDERTDGGGGRWTGSPAKAEGNEPVSGRQITVSAGVLVGRVTLGGGDEALGKGASTAAW